MNPHGDSPPPRRNRSDDPAVGADEQQHGGITDSTLAPDADADVEAPDPSLTDDAADAEGHPS